MKAVLAPATAPPNLESSSPKKRKAHRLEPGRPLQLGGAQRPEVFVIASGKKKKKSEYTAKEEKDKKGKMARMGMDELGEDDPAVEHVREVEGPGAPEKGKKGKN